MYFGNYRLWKTWLDKYLKTRLSDEPSTDNMGNGWKTLLQSKRQHLQKIYSWVWRKLRWKKSVLVIYKILRLFVNTLTADDKLYLLNRNNLTSPIQMSLSLKQKTFPQFFFAFLESILNFKHLAKKDDPHSYVFLETLATKNMVR